MAPPHSMARFLSALLLGSALLVVAQQSHAAAPSTTEDFWHTALPDTPLPDAVRWYLAEPDTSSQGTTSAGDDAHNAVNEERLSQQWPYYFYSLKQQGSASPKPTIDNKPEATDDTAEQLSQQWPYYFYSLKQQGSSAAPKPTSTDDTEERLSQQWPYYFYSLIRKQRSTTSKPVVDNKQPAADRKQPATTDDTEERLSQQWPYYFYSLIKKQLSASPKPATSHSHMRAAAAHNREAKMNHSSMFFFEEALQVGQSLPFHFHPARRAPLGMLPRKVADSIPFSTSELPGVLAWLGVAAGSPQAADMEETVSMCEATASTVAAEGRFCATSLEALVEHAMAALGITRGIRPVMSDRPRSGAPWQPYTIRAVRPLANGAARFVACHNVVYPYTVYRCHDTGLARLYMVEMEGTRGGGRIKEAVMCHIDTSQWKPDHISFKLLGTQPGGPPICHTMPYGHIVWAKKNDHGHSSA